MPRRSLSQSLLAKFRRDQEGQVSLIFGLAAIPIVAAVGAAVDYSHGNQVRTSLQKAVDSAVLSAAIDGSSNWQTAALNAFTGNRDDKGSSLGTPLFSMQSAGTPTFSAQGDVYSGTITAVVPTSFMKIVGIDSFPVTASSSATTAKIPLCVLGLNAFDKGAFDMNGNSKFSGPNCAVQVNSKDSKGMTQEGQPTAVARKFGVSGAHTGNGFTPAPKDGSAPINDPYASIPFPDHDTCGSGGKGLTINGGSTTLSPGTFCGGIRIKGGASVTLSAGIYVMVDGSFWLDGGSSATGKEVVIAFTGDDATLRVWGNSTIDLTSPTSGTYKNFQFFQDPNDQKGRGAWVSIGGNGNSADTSKATWDGIAYFPTQNFWVYGNTVVNINSPSMALVAGQIWVQGNAGLNVTNDNPRKVAVNPVTTAGGARLTR